MLAGSVPPGVDTAVYARLIGELQRLGVPAVLDTDGSRCARPSRRACRRRPERRRGRGGGRPRVQRRRRVAMGSPACSRWVPARRSSRARRDASRSSPTTAAAATRCRSTRSSPSPASGRATLPRGLRGRPLRGGNPRECLANGVACGAESTQHFGAGNLNPHEVERLLPRVEVRELDVPAGVS